LIIRIEFTYNRYSLSNFNFIQGYTMRYLLYILFAFLLLGCGPGDHMDDDVETTSTHNFLYYGDITNNGVVKLDITLMEERPSIASNGLYPYEVAKALDNDLYVLNRHDNVIGVLDTTNDTIVDEILLSFFPRSISINSSNNILLTGSNKPDATTIADNSLTNVYSDSSYKTPTSYGGTNATGHPVWIDENYFLLLDRTEDTIELYQKSLNTPIDKLRTKSSVHHVLAKNGIFYGISEGRQNGVSPGIVKFTVSNGKINLLQERLLSELSNLPTDFTPNVWGSHHGAFHPTQNYIYMGSAEGNVFVLDLENLNLADTFKAGRGVGHFTFYNNMLITTNHYDTIKTFHDTTNPRSHKYITSLSFGDIIYSGITMQSHTTHIVDSSLYFMYNTDRDSTLYEIDLNSISIRRKITLPNHYCLMGTIVSDTVTSTGM